MSPTAAPLLPVLDKNQTGFAPFSNIDGKRETPRLVKFASISDGLSNTLMMSEYLKAQNPDDVDWRGDIHNDEGVFRFHTIYSPNSSVADVIPNGWYEKNGDPLMPATPGAFEAQKNAARSRHSGGINAFHCDASVAFYSDDIAPNAWKALGTMDGGMR